MYPPKVWDKISPRLFATFWALACSDIVLPTQRYTTEIERIETLVKQVSACSLWGSSWTIVHLDLCDNNGYHATQWLPWQNTWHFETTLITNNSSWQHPGNHDNTLVTMTTHWLSWQHTGYHDNGQVNDNEELAQRRKDKQVEQHKEMMGRLKEEQTAQENNHKLVLARLEAEKDVWFASTNSSKVDAIMQVINF